MVDFAWKIEKAKLENESRNGEHQKDIYGLSNNHPIVNVERTIWEVQAAANQTIQNIEDLALHKSLIKRIQVMVNVIKNLLGYLIEEEEVTEEEEEDEVHESNDEMPVSMIKILKNESTITRTRSLNKPDYSRTKGLKSPVKVLTSVSRIIIGENRSMSIIEDETSAADIHVTDATASYLEYRNRRPGNKHTKIKTAKNGKSFRNVTLRSNLVNKTKENISRMQMPVTPSLADETIHRLSHSMGPMMPFSTRAKQGSEHDPASNMNSIYYTPSRNLSSKYATPSAKRFPLLAVPNEFDLSQILNKLTLLSHELSMSLQNAEDAEINTVSEVKQEAADMIIKETEELRSINDSIANASSATQKKSDIIYNGNSDVTQSNIDLKYRTTTKEYDKNASVARDNRTPLKAICNKNNEKTTSSNQKLQCILPTPNYNNNPVPTKFKHVKQERCRAKLEIEKYAASAIVSLTTPERRKDNEEMDKRVAQLLKTS